MDIKSCGVDLVAKGNSHSRKELRLKLVSLNKAQIGYIYSGAKDAKNL